MTTVERTTCPACGSEAEAEFEETDAGLKQVGPFRCACGWEEDAFIPGLILDDYQGRD